VFHRSAPWLGASAGSFVLAAGTVLIVVSAAAGSSTTFVVGSVVAGLGFGVAFLGGLRNLVSVIPAEHRAAVMSAFYLVAYLSLSLPAVAAGVVVTHIGVERTFEVFGSVVAAVALLLGAEAWRSRPRALVEAVAAQPS
jgi:predicted MFS family arabinose efflux permease